MPTRSHLVAWSLGGAVVAAGYQSIATAIGRNGEIVERFVVLSQVSFNLAQHSTAQSLGRSTPVCRYVFHHSDRGFGPTDHQVESNPHPEVGVKSIFDTDFYISIIPPNYLKSSNDADLTFLLFFFLIAPSIG